MKTEMHIVHVPWPVTCRWWWWSSADGRFFSHPLCADEEIMLKLFIFLIYFHFLTLRSPTSMLKLTLPLSFTLPTLIFQHHCCKWNVLVKFWKNSDNSLKSGFFRCWRKNRKCEIENSVNWNSNGGASFFYFGLNVGEVERQGKCCGSDNNCFWMLMIIIQGEFSQIFSDICIEFPGAHACTRC